MMERRYAARWPPESFFRVPQIAHYVSVFPATFLRSRSAQVCRRRWTVVHRTQPITIRAHTVINCNRTQELCATGKEKTCSDVQVLRLIHSRQWRLDLQVTDFMRSYDDARKATGVFNDCDTIDFLETFVHYACTAHVRESYTYEHGD